MFDAMITFELYFLFNIVFTFFVEYDVDGQILPERNLPNIARNYLRNGFLIEVLPTLPLQFLPLGGDENRLYIIKLVRIVNGISLLDASKIYEGLTVYNMRRIKNLIENDDFRANLMDYDQIYLRYLMMFKYFVSTCKLIVTIMSLSYFLGVIWFIFSFELFHHQEEELETLNGQIYNTETFITTNSLDPHEPTRTDVHNMFLLMYFAYTTLSTVGFGDFNPRSDSERLFCILILMLGVGIFGLILNNFSEILLRFQSLDEDYQDEDQLNMFFDTLKNRYNHGYDIEEDLKHNIERLMRYRWMHDRNQAM